MVLASNPFATCQYPSLQSLKRSILGMMVWENAIRILLVKVVTEHRKVSVPPTLSQVNKAPNAGPFEPQAVQYNAHIGACIPQND